MSAETLEAYCDGNYDGPDPTAGVLIALAITIVLCFANYYLFTTYLANIKYQMAYFLVVESVIMCTGNGFMSYYIHIWRFDEHGSFDRWFNSLDQTAGGVMVGGVTMLIFGFLDNAGLFFGSTYLDEVFEMFPGAEDANVFAGYGNTYSDFLGAFLGTFVGYIVGDMTDYNPNVSPIWMQGLALIIGCLFGILIPVLIMGTDSQEHGANKINAKSILLGNMDEEELYEIIMNKKSAMEYRCHKIFNRIDEDDSNTLEIDELRQYMKKALGDAYDEEAFETLLKTYFDGEKKDNFTLEEFTVCYKNMARNMLKEMQADNTHNKLEDE